MIRPVLFDNWFVSGNDEQVKQKAWREQGFKDAARTLSRTLSTQRTDPPQNTMTSITGQIYRICQECEPERLEIFEEVLSMKSGEQFLLREELSKKMRSGRAVKRPLEGASAASTQPVPPTGKRPLEGASAASTQPVPPTAVSAASDVLDDTGLRERVIQMYQQFNPKQLDRIDEIFSKYPGSLHKLLAELGKKYLPAAPPVTESPKMLPARLEPPRSPPLPPTQHSEMHVDTPPPSPRRQDFPVPASAFRGNRPHGDDKERKDFVSRVKDGDSRVMKPAEVSGAQLQQIMMDHACLLLSSFHRIVSPYASDRCAVNPKTNHLVRSITNRSRFVQDASKFAYELLYGDRLATDLPANFYLLPAARDVTHHLVMEACKQKQGRWQWAGFRLSAWEFEHCKTEILRLFVAGLTSDSAPAVSS